MALSGTHSFHLVRKTIVLSAQFLHHRPPACSPVLHAPDCSGKKVRGPGRGGRNRPARKSKRSGAALWGIRTVEPVKPPVTLFLFNRADGIAVRPNHFRLLLQHISVQNRYLLHHPGPQRRRQQNSQEKQRQGKPCPNGQRRHMKKFIQQIQEYGVNQIDSKAKP